MYLRHLNLFSGPYQMQADRPVLPHREQGEYYNDKQGNNQRCSTLFLFPWLFGGETVVLI